jgi:REP element-mobilizing transposase RayT
MARLPRIYVKGALYYVSCYGVHQEDIFKKEKDYLMYLELVKKYKQQYNFKLFAYTLMPNRLYLLLELSREGISEIMHDINSAYTKYFNSSYQRRGHLFRDRFRSLIAEKRPYLLDLIAYLHYSPLRAGLTKALSEYPFSSHLSYLYYNSPPAATAGKADLSKILGLEAEIKEVLSLLAETCPEGKDYPGFINTLTPERLERINKQIQRTRVLGSKEFLGYVRSEIRHKEAEEKEGQKGLPSRNILSFVVIISVLLGATGLWLYFYVQRNIAIKEKEIYERLKKEQEQRPAQKQILTELDGTEWTIQIKSGTQKPYARFDKIRFTDGRFSSRYFSSRGFAPSNYTLTIRDGGVFIWETMQTSEGQGVVFWRAETTAEGIMKGKITIQPRDDSPEDFYFESRGYTRRQ